MACFTVGAVDAAELAREFTPEFEQEHLVDLDKYQIVLKLMVDGLTSRPFTATTLPPLPFPQEVPRDKVLSRALARTARSRKKIERDIRLKMQR